MKKLYLEDLKDFNLKQLKTHIANNYAGTVSGFDYENPSKEEISSLRKTLNDYNILIAYESVGSWGCDSSSFFLLEKKSSGRLFEVHGSHCSCYGFEGQWLIEKTTKKYLKSDKFYFSSGGYDENDKQNKREAIIFINKL